MTEGLDKSEPRRARELEELFHEAMLSLYETWRNECRFRDRLGRSRPYVAVRFRQGVKNNGGLRAAKNLLMKPGGSPGFQKLKQCGKLYLSVEALVLQVPWRDLFTEKEIAIAEKRLIEAKT